LCGSLCPARSTLTIDVYEKHVAHRNLKAHVDIPIAVVKARTQSLSGEFNLTKGIMVKLMYTSDMENGAHVILTFSVLQDNDDAEVKKTGEVAEAAKKKAGEKQTILDKLGRVRSLIDLIKPIGEGVSGVSAFPSAS
jgi:hypothetical protein